jgi:hypothetical protein
MRWNFHGVTVDGQTTHSELAERWRQTFASRPASTAAPEISCALEVAPAAPPAPAGEPNFRQGALLEYYVAGESVIAHFPRFGQLRLDLAHGTTVGTLTSAALETYGVLEDLLAIGLSPHLRRRGQFLIHAFAATSPLPAGEGLGVMANPKAILLVGSIGSGKTTTGLALLNAGWQLLSNDSPILRAPDEVLSYPGLLAAYPETYTRFPATAHLSTLAPAGVGRQKITAAAESLWPNVWQESARATAIFFPQVEARAEHALEPLRPPDALKLLLPHAIEQWDKAMMPAHLALLTEFAKTVPAYRLRLGPNVHGLPNLLAATIL